MTATVTGIATAIKYRRTRLFLVNVPCGQRNYPVPVAKQGERHDRRRKPSDRARHERLEHDVLRARFHSQADNRHVWGRRLGPSVDLSR